jgi:hypothetical protein
MASLSKHAMQPRQAAKQVLSPALRSPAPSSTTTRVLALQRAAGNKAVATSLGKQSDRPVVQRSAEDSDIASQEMQDELATVLHVTFAKMKVQSAMRQMGLLEPEPEPEKPRRDKRLPGGGKMRRKRDYRDHPYKRPTIQTAAVATGFGGGQINWNEINFNPTTKAKGIKAKSKTDGGATAAQTSVGSYNRSLHAEPNGGPVGAQRPLNWVDFTALTGGSTPFKQGHSLHQRLGGQGTPENLSPFTGSLNGLHYGRAEEQVKAFANSTRSVGYAHYDVDINYGNNAAIATWARNRFDQLVVQDVKWAIASMEAAGIITLANSATYTAANAIPAGEIAATHTWLNTYVQNTFPVSIGVTAKFFEQVGTSANWKRSSRQQINITNDF